MCRQDFSNRSDFMAHIRDHFIDTKMGGGDEISAADLLTKTLLGTSSTNNNNNNNGQCT